MNETIKPADLNAEFPGLDAISRKVFDVPYADSTPDLRRHVQIIAKRDAAQAMYEALEFLGTIQCSCKPVGHRTKLPTYSDH